MFLLSVAAAASGVLERSSDVERRDRAWVVVRQLSADVALEAVRLPRLRGCQLIAEQHLILR